MSEGLYDRTIVGRYMDSYATIFVPLLLFMFLIYMMISQRNMMYLALALTVPESIFAYTLHYWHNHGGCAL